VRERAINEKRQKQERNPVDGGSHVWRGSIAEFRSRFLSFAWKSCGRPGVAATFCARWSGQPWR
jgi:hypothetical protein